MNSFQRNILKLHPFFSHIKGMMWCVIFFFSAYPKMFPASPKGPLSLHCFRANNTWVNYSEGRLGRPSGEGHYCCLVLEYFKINNPYWFISRPVMMSIIHYWYQNSFRFFINYSTQKRKASEAEVLQMFHFLHQSFNEIGRMMDKSIKSHLQLQEEPWVLPFTAVSAWYGLRPPKNSSKFSKIIEKHFESPFKGQGWSH